MRFRSKDNDKQCKHIKVPKTVTPQQHHEAIHLSLNSGAKASGCLWYNHICISSRVWYDLLPKFLLARFNHNEARCTHSIYKGHAIQGVSERASAQNENIFLPRKGHSTRAMKRLAGAHMRAQRKPIHYQSRLQSAELINFQRWRTGNRITPMTEAYQEGSGITDKIDYNRSDLVKALG